jgi:hypothetical protein
MKKKVLIQTLFYQNYNYGAMLQAYALYHKLEEMGFQCTELNYSSKAVGILSKIKYKSFRTIEIIWNLKYFVGCYRNAGKEKQRHKRYIEICGGIDCMKKIFDCFSQQEFLSTPVYYPDTIETCSTDYDYYIVGGDQVWHPLGIDKVRALGWQGIKGKRIAYSCSAGKSDFTFIDKWKIKKYVKDIDAVSVRELNFSELLKEEGIRNEIIADPVYLFTKQEWEEFAAQKYYIEEDYIFAYLLGEDSTSRKYIKMFAEENNLKIVSFPHVQRKYAECDLGFADIPIMDAGPREFVEILSGAKYVITDSFHGTALSLIMEKQFLSFYRQNNNDRRNLNVRIDFLLKEYGLNEYMQKLEELGKCKLENINYISYEEKKAVTRKKRERAFAFLDKELES